ncbi:hypothetical protein GCM10009727_16720 [Actinomadura napierensis]|uniref:Uncharacterized protein n=1 Tax=Actinomadura napierensis TaxID=267854 RepID=A0ABN2YH08_9ACTN
MRGPPRNSGRIGRIWLSSGCRGGRFVVLIFDHRPIGSGVSGALKNLIFAAIGPKPEIVLDDAVNNDLRIVRNCLVYDRALAAHGLTWADLTGWWADRQGMTGEHADDIFRSLYRSLGDNNAERRILRAYADRYDQLGPDTPALIPQVYLHYDPLHRRAARTRPARAPAHGRPAGRAGRSRTGCSPRAGGVCRCSTAGRPPPTAGRWGPGCRPG